MDACGGALPDVSAANPGVALNFQTSEVVIVCTVADVFIATPRMKNGRSAGRYEERRYSLRQYNPGTAATATSVPPPMKPPLKVCAGNELPPAGKLTASNRVEVQPPFT